MHRGLLEKNTAENDRWEPRPAPRLSRTPGERLHARRSPLPGQHTRVVLQEYGFDTAAIGRLIESGIVGELSPERYNSAL